LEGPTSEEPKKILRLRRALAGMRKFKVRWWGLRTEEGTFGAVKQYPDKPVPGIMQVLVRRLC